MESSADLKEGGDASANPDLASGGACDAREELQQGALASTILSDDAYDIALLNGEVDVLECPYVLAVALPRPVVGVADLQVRIVLTQHIHCPPPVKVVGKGAGGDEPQSILLAYVVEFYC